MTDPAEHEAERQAALDELAIDAFEDVAFDDITRMAAEVFEVPIATITLVDRDRQWFKSKVGLSVSETRRDIAFCDHTIRQPHATLVVEDATKDPRFADNPLVLADPNIRFYAAAPLTLSSGLAIGAVCVIDTKPRTISPDKLEHLKFLARQVVAKMESLRDALAASGAGGSSGAARNSAT